MANSDYNSSGHLTREAQNRRSRERKDAYNRGIAKMKEQREKEIARRKAGAKKISQAAKAARAKQATMQSSVPASNSKVPVILIQ